MLRERHSLRRLMACRPAAAAAGGRVHRLRPLRALARIALLLFVPSGAVPDVTNYTTLQQAVAAGGSHLVTGDIMDWPAKGSLWLNSATNASLTLTGSCGDQPCVLDAQYSSAHFVVPPGFSLTLNNLVLANGGRGGSDDGEACLGLLARRGDGDPDPLSLTGDCTVPPKPTTIYFLPFGQDWSADDTLCGRLQCGTVVVAANASLHVSRCAFVNNTASSDGTYFARGSAISIVATAGFTITDSAFVSNSVRSTYQSLAHGGGAVSIMQPFNSMKFVSGGAFPPMLIQNTVFQHNFVYGIGGAISSQIGVGTLQVLNCSFDSNTAFGVGTATTGLGGAVAISTMKFNSPFQGADITHRYGNFYAYFWWDEKDPNPPDAEHADFSLHAHYIFADAAFTNNGALPLLPTVPSPTSGGALYLGNGGYGASFTRCSFSANTASRGGAIYYRGQSVESVLVLEDLGLEVIPYNTHGIIPNDYQLDHGLLATGIQAISFTDGEGNWKEDNALYTQHAGRDDDYLALQLMNADYNSLAPVAQASGYMVSLVNCSFSSNNATFLAPETAGRGGALYVACGALDASGTSFISNAALAGTGFSSGLGSYGGAVYATNECSTPDMTTFVTTNVTLFNSVFRGNSADTEGGAVAVENLDPSALQSAASIVVSATGTTFDGNSASAGQGRGGALFGDSFAVFRLESCSAVNNQASQGGAVHTSGPFTALQSSFSGNVAALQGGALYLTASASLAAVNLTANRATVGGALFVDGVASLRACLLAANAAVNGSAVAVAAGSNTSVSATSFSGHAATQFGTVFVSDAPAGLALAALFANNTAQAGGSVFYDTTNTSNAVQPGSGDDQVVANFGPNAASVPAAASFAVNGRNATGSSAAVALKSGAPMSLAFTLADGFGQLVDTWRDAAFDVTCTAFAAAPGAAPGGCPPAALRGVRHAAYFGGSTFVAVQVFGGIGASALLTATLQSPTVPILLPPAGLSYTVTVTVSQCAPLETFDAGKQLCLCAIGAFLNASSGACSTCPPGSNAPQLGANYCNPNPPGYVSTTQTTLAANVTLAGVSASNFIASTSAALTASLTATLGVPSGAVNVTGVVDAPVPAGRRLLAASAVAAYAVTTTNSSLAASLRTTLGNTAALGTSLTAALQRSGDPALSQVTGAVPALPTEMSVVLAAEACPAGTYLDSNSQACQACQSPLVTTAVGSTACEPCPTLFAWASAAKCVACPPNSIVSPSDQTRCACQAGYYDSLYGTNVTVPDCALCPPGGACDTGFLAAAEGFWRPTVRSTDLYACRAGNCLAENITGPLSALATGFTPLAYANVSAVPDNCVPGNTGPFCAVCLPGYALQSGECAPCRPRDAWVNWSRGARGGLLAACVVFALAFIALAFLQPVLPGLERGVSAATARASAAAERVQRHATACMHRCCVCCFREVKAPSGDQPPSPPAHANEDGVTRQTSVQLSAVTVDGDGAQAAMPAESAVSAPQPQPQPHAGFHHKTRKLDVAAVERSLAANAAFAMGNVAAFVADVDGGVEEEDTGAAEAVSGVERHTDAMDRLDEAISQFKAYLKILIKCAPQRQCSTHAPPARARLTRLRRREQLLPDHLHVPAVARRKMAGCVRGRDDARERRER